MASSLPARGVIWVKTEAGRTEMRTRSLVAERVRRNLLLLIDGIKTDEVLLASVSGATREDIERLQELGLVEPLAPAAPAAGAAAPTAVDLAVGDDDPLGYEQFTARLTDLIASELGLRGFMLTLAVEKAATPAELQQVARRVIAEIGTRKGAEAAKAAETRLYGS